MKYLLALLLVLPTSASFASEVPKLAFERSGDDGNIKFLAELLPVRCRPCFENAAALGVINTLFPSPTTEEGSHGGLILLRLKKTGENPNIVVSAKYEDRSGERQKVTAKLEFKPDGESYGSPSIRKGILLARYATMNKTGGHGPPIGVLADLSRPESGCGGVF